MISAYARVFLALSFGLLSCKRTNGAGDAETASLPDAEASRSASAGKIHVLDPLHREERCTLGHHGVLIDRGEKRARGGNDPLMVERDGASWERVRGRTLAANFVWTDDLPMDAPDAGTGDVYAEARVRSVTARTVTAFLNGKILGTATLKPNDTRVVQLRGGIATLVQGGNEIVLRFSGGPRHDDASVAEVDWIHVGSGDPMDAYSAPTRVDAVTSTTIAGISKPAWSLRGPGFARCSGWLPPGAEISTSFALLGQGEADVEVRWLKDRLPKRALATVHVSSGAPWMANKVTLAAAGGGLGAVEWAVVRATRGSRVLIGEPRVSVTAPEEVAPPPLKSAIVVVLGSVIPRAISLYGGSTSTPEMAGLAAGGILFSNHRAGIPIASGSLASLLTGLHPTRHTVEDVDAKLPKALTTIADAAKQAGFDTAMFTANPQTSAVFGFDRGFQTFASRFPNDASASTEVFEDASRWLETHHDSRFLLVVHAPGGHPPWPVSNENLRMLPAAEFDPRRAAELLSKSRKYPGRFGDADRTRAWASYSRSLQDTDAALGRLLGSLRASGRDRDTLVVLTGDVGANEASLASFIDTESLDEPLLAIPLAMRFGSQTMKRRIDVATTHEDVATTLLAALGLAAPSTFQGRNLIALAHSPLASVDTPVAATSTGARYSIRWGSFVMNGTRDRSARLCELTLEPSCLTDVRATFPLAAEALGDEVNGLWRDGRPKGVERTQAVIDPQTMSALYVWGRPYERNAKDD